MRLARKSSIRDAMLTGLSCFNPSGVLVIPRVPPAPASVAKHALIVVPFYGLDGASIVVDSIAASLRAEGYTVHGLHYSNFPERPASPFWDHSYFLDVQSGRFGHPRARDEGLSGHDFIDDWAGDELGVFTASLARSFDFDICICSYVFLSRCFASLPAKSLRVLFAPDVFAGRNARISAAGGSSKGWFFSTTEAEEAKGLRRADRVIAIQAEDGARFAAVIGAAHVDVLPYMPPQRFLPARAITVPMIIGYIGSDHPPNVDALVAFIADYDFANGSALHVAGGVCTALRGLKLPSQVRLLGPVKDLAGFYAGCDLLINPDMLRSGLKIKCVEALSYGKPLICTAPASVGICVNAPYHRASSIKDVARYAADAARDPHLLAAMAAESRHVFQNYQECDGTADMARFYAALVAYKAMAETPAEGTTQAFAARRDVTMQPSDSALKY